MADTNNQKLRVTELDFDEIKDNLKTFLKNQSEFKDYDFEGSGMSILLDTLAYNTHYMGFNANMLANEMFLDSAALRSSVVSHAKTLGYEPNSCRAPKATIGVALTTTNSTATMPAGTKFTTTVDGVSYQFVTITSRSASSSGNTINFDNTEIYEGTYVTTKYTVDNSDTEQRFIITDNRADTTTLTVTVQNSSSDTFTTTYTKATDISQLTINSTVYFLQEVEQGRFEVYFGDGVVSKALTDGNIVKALLENFITLYPGKRFINNAYKTGRFNQSTGAVTTPSEIQTTNTNTDTAPVNVNQAASDYGFDLNQIDTTTPSPTEPSTTVVEENVSTEEISPAVAKAKRRTWLKKIKPLALTEKNDDGTPVFDKKQFEESARFSDIEKDYGGKVKDKFLTAEFAQLLLHLNHL